MTFYKIIPIEIITEDVISKCVQTSMDTLRKNIVETYAILKYIQGQCPIEIINYTEYTKEQLLSIINDPTNGWIVELP